VTLTPDGERLLPYARRVLHRARELAPGHELMARYESGLTGAAGELLAGRQSPHAGVDRPRAAAVRGAGHRDRATGTTGRREEEFQRVMARTRDPVPA
jgi:hypothetical protein